MLTESCIGCDADVPLSGAVHMLVNSKGDAGVADGYLCRSCYEEHVEPLLPDEPEEPEESGTAEESWEPDESEETADDTGARSGDGEDGARDRDDRTLEEA